MFEIQDKPNEFNAADMLRACRFRAVRALQRMERLDEAIEHRLLSDKLSLAERLKLERADFALVIDALQITNAYGELDAKYQLAAHEARQRNQGSSYWTGQLIAAYIDKSLSFKMPMPTLMRTQLNEIRTKIEEALAKDAESKSAGRPNFFYGHS